MNKKYVLQVLMQYIGEKILTYYKKISFNFYQSN